MFLSIGIAMTDFSLVSVYAIICLTYVRYTVVRFLYPSTLGIFLLLLSCLFAFAYIGFSLQHFFQLGNLTFYANHNMILNVEVGDKLHSVQHTLFKYLIQCKL